MAGKLLNEGWSCFLLLFTENELSNAIRGCENQYVHQDFYRIYLQKVYLPDIVFIMDFQEILDIRFDLIVGLLEFIDAVFLLDYVSDEGVLFVHSFKPEGINVRAVHIKSLSQDLDHVHWVDLLEEVVSGCYLQVLGQLAHLHEEFDCLVLHDHVVMWSHLGGQLRKDLFALKHVVHYVLAFLVDQDVDRW
jgi:hypothetical protein